MPLTAALSAALVDATAATIASVGLSTATPADDGSGFTEPTEAGYARVGVNVAGWTLDSTSIVNDEMVDFDGADASWGTVTHFGLFNAAGDLLAWEALGTSQAISKGFVPHFSSGQLQITF